MWACSKSTAETLRSYGFNGEISVMENGVEPMPEGDIESFTSKARAIVNVPEGKKVLLFVGQQIWHKNLRLFLDTVKALADKRDDIIAVIAGTGYDEKEIKKYASSLSLGDKLIFTGEIDDRKTLFGLYAMADLFFFPSVYDNAPLVVREAAMAGTPALLTRGSNSAEIIEDGVNGYLAENDVGSMTNKIEEIFDGGTIGAVGARAKETIPVLWAEIARRVIEKYRSDLSGGDPPREDANDDE